MAKHLSTRPADSGASADYWPLMIGAHTKREETRADVWAGNADTDKYWAKVK